MDKGGILFCTPNFVLLTSGGFGQRKGDKENGGRIKIRVTPMAPLKVNL